MRSGLQRILARRSFRVGVHLAVIGGLLLSLALLPLAEDYFSRGVVSDPGWPPIAHTDVNPLGINVFLNEEPDPAVVERSLDMIQAAGFGYIRQVFGWYEIEPEPDTFVNASGRSTWEKYDRIVDLAAERGIQVIARLEKPPPWARAGQAHPEIAGPPDRIADYAEFVGRVVSRYRDKLTYVQIWNEPNLQGEWGGAPIDPYGYVQLLEAGYRAAKQANPEAVVLLAGLAPTDQLGPQNLSDLVFLQRVYDFGGAAYFDIAAVMVYGYGYPPSDRRVGFGRNNFSRPIQTREIMERNGDAATAIWAVEYGWVSLPEDWAGQPSPWGDSVSAEQQAEYLVEGYLRAQREWPWMGVMAVWAFRFPRPADAPDQAGNPTRGFTIVEYDFTPRPAYLALQEASPRLQRDFTDAYALTLSNAATLSAGEPLTLHISGTGLQLVSEGAGTIRARVDGGAPQEVTLAAGASAVVDGLSDGTHDIELSLASPPSSSEIVIEGYIVTRQARTEWIFSWLQRGLTAFVLLAAVSLGWTLRRARVASTRSGVHFRAAPRAEPGASIRSSR